MKIHTLMAAVVSASFLTACMPMTPYLDAHYGETAQMAVAQQTINPDAAQNTNPVKGVDGTTAKNAIELYHNASKAPPATTNIFNIGIGSGQ